MSGYLLLAGEAVGTVPAAVLPETVVMGFSTSDVNGGDVSGELVTGRECLCACFPFAGMGT